jgi:DNA repair protein RecO
MAKGVRRPRSKICGAMEPFNFDEVIFYKREFKEIYNLSDAVVIDGFEKIRNDPQRVNAALVLCEFYHKTLPAEEPDHRAFSLFMDFMNNLKHVTGPVVRSVALTYLFRAFSGAGVMPHLEDCVRCHKAIQNNGKVDFSISSGGIVCGEHYDDTVIFLSRPTIATLMNINTTAQPYFEDSSLDEIESFIADYIYVHLSNLRLNSLKQLR